MITFICSLLLLFLGFLFYGNLVTKIFKPDDRQTPAVAHPDGVDYVPMKTWKVYLIQLLNIAGTGPIFGALMGAIFGPVVYLWIVFGCILGGAVHDYMGGMISVRMNGASISEIVGKYLGTTSKQVMRIFSVILLVLIGTVFTTGPASLIARLTPDFLNTRFWIFAILIYYLLATLLPIDKLIGKLYPVFGIVLITMAVGIIFGLVAGGYHLPELVVKNQHPDKLPIFPFMSITVACGAVSGFHATQSPMMARCITNEKDGKKVFYGAMISEGIIALVWAAAGVSFYGTTGNLQNSLNELGQSGLVYDISLKLLGVVGGILAVIGVIACPISSGDTAFRSARLTIADWFKIDQSKFSKRFLITIPLLIVSTYLTYFDFGIIWRYFSWSNQTLAMITLWATSIYLARNANKWWYSLISAIPAAYMSAVTSSYILMAKEGFRLNGVIAYPIGISFALVCTVLYFIKAIPKKELKKVNV